MKNMGCCNYY